MGILDDFLNKVTGDSNDENLEKAEDKKTSPEELVQLSKSDNEEIREAVASNPNCPTSVLEKLAEDEEDWVRHNVAENPNCPTSVLGKLASDEDTTVRISVAENSNCSNEILEILKDDEDEEVIEHALHSLFKTNSQLIEQFIKSGNDNQLNAVASFEGTPENLLKNLVLRKDFKAEYTCLAIANNNLTEKSLKKIYDKVFRENDSQSSLDLLAISIAQNDNLSSEILAELSSYSEYEVREKVAQHSNTSLDILVKLTGDEISFVAKEALAKLINDKEEPKDELIIILENIISNLTASGGKVGEIGDVDVVSGLTQENVDYYKEAARKSIKKLKA